MSPAPLVRSEDIELVKQFIILPILLKYLEQDVQTMKNVHLNLSVVYFSNLRGSYKKCLHDIQFLKNQLQRDGIKIIMEEQDEIGLHVQYLCRGYQHELTLLWGFIKGQISIHLSRYLNIELTDDGN